VEFMMGLPAGHVTDPAIGLSRAQALKALGNGVVPQQASLALRALLGLPLTAAPPATGVILPTPTASQPGGTAERHVARKGGGRTAVTDLGMVVTQRLPLLPTPAVNDMGAGKTPEAWDEWTAKMRATHGNGNGHGPSLSIEALRLGGGE